MTVRSSDLTGVLVSCAKNSVVWYVPVLRGAVVYMCVCVCLCCMVECAT